MAYSDFTLEKAVDKLGVELVENISLFSHASTTDIPPFLKLYFDRDSALSGNSEKARSEKFIAPILDEVFSTNPRKFTLFSGENFDVDKDLDLKGVADFLICLSTTQALIQAPIIALAESKKNDPIEGFGQCVAEIFAAALFNERKNKSKERLFFISSNGFDWMFGEYLVSKKIITYDPTKYSIRELPRIIGILTFMRDEALRMYDKPR